MPVAAPLIGAGASLLGGLFGAKKPKQETESTTNGTRTSQATQASSNEQNRTFDENPLFGQGREQLLSALMSEFNKAQKPVYGQAQQSGFMEQLNNLASSAMGSLQQNVAGSGGVHSGRFAGGIEGIQRDKFGKASQFFAGLPAQEEAIRSKKTNDLLGLASNWLGLGPVNETITGQAQANSSSNETTNSSTRGTQQGNDGGGGWGSALGGLAQFGGGLLGDVVGGNGSKWGIGWKPGGSGRGGTF